MAAQKLNDSTGHDYVFYIIFTIMSLEDFKHTDQPQATHIRTIAYLESLSLTTN